MPDRPSRSASQRGPALRYWGWGLLAVLAVAGALLLRASLGKVPGEWATPTAAGATARAGAGPFLMNVALAGWALVVALVLGFPVGVRLGSRPGAVLAALVVVPLAVPAHLSAYLWRFLLEDLSRGLLGVGGWWRSPVWSFVGAGWTLSALYWPVVALPVAAAMRLRGRRVEEELATLAPPRAVFWRAVLPGLMPGLAVGGGVFFLLALSNYAVPLMWNLPSQNVAVFARLAAFYSPAEAMRLTLPLLATVLGTSAAGVAWLARRPYGLDLTSIEAGPAAGPGAAGGRFSGFSAAVLAVTVAPPGLALVSGPRSLALVRANLVAGGGSYLWGLALAALGATGAVLMGWGLACLVRSAGRVTAAVVEVVGLTALFVPAAVVCLVLAGVLAGPRWLSVLYDSLWVFLLAYGVRYFYLPYKMVRFVQRFEGREHRETQQLLGLGPLQRLRLSVWGVARPALTLSWLIILALVLGETEVAAFLAQPGRQPVSVFLDNLMHYGRSSAVTQWAVILVVTEMLIAGCVLWVGLRQWRKLSVRT